MRVIRSMRPLPAEDDVRRWLRAVVHSCAYDRLRSETRRRRRETAAARTRPLTAPPARNHTDEEQRLEWLERQLGSLDDRSLQILLGSAFKPGKIRIYFEYAAPSYVATYESVFSGAQLNFEADHNELHFPASWLENPVDHAIEGMEDVYTAMCERVLGRGDTSADTVEHVRRLLLSRPGRKMYRLEEAAEQLRLSPTQLRKRLYRADTSFKTLVLEIRMELAKHYLLDSRLAVQEIAYLLDYSQAAPFSRAFKAHCEVSPDQYRQLHGRPAGTKM